MAQAQRKARRQTRAQKEAEALAGFEAALRALPDPRRKQGLRYPLRSVVTIALMAMVCGADDAEAMQVWGEQNEDWLETFLELPHGTPSQDVFLSVFAALSPPAFSEVFVQWVALLKVRLAAQGKHIAIDGKTSRRSFDNSQQRPALHTVSAFLSETGLVVGQCKTEDKSNEITAIPRLLSLIDIRGATLSIDAMGCQRDIAKAIIDGGGHYLLQVKGNQPTLRDDIVRIFDDVCDETPRPLDQPAPRHAMRFDEEVSKKHGRLEQRSTYLCTDLKGLDTKQDWAGLHFVAMVRARRTELASGRTSEETRYYIGSDPKAKAADVACLIRRHWSIENELHWVLDMAFNEDAARHRAGNCAANLATLRHFAVNLLKADKTVKLGVANKRKRAGWSRDYLVQLLTAA